MEVWVHHTGGERPLFVSGGAGGDEAVTLDHPPRLTAIEPAVTAL
jgi:hypothetical protein